MAAVIGEETKGLLPAADSAIAVHAHAPEPMYLHWQDLTHEVTVNVNYEVDKEGNKVPLPSAVPEKEKLFKKFPEQRLILNHVTGYCKPKQLLAVMGSSGAGKTSLLNALAGRTEKQEFSGGPGLQGKVLYNGKEAYPEGESPAFVEQNDLFYKTLTIHEHLSYQAQLRLPGPEEKRQARVLEVLKELNLDIKAGNRIGLPGEGISGGERRRLSFATEILSDPALLFIDEPTSGLDSHMATEVMSMLRKLASRGRTVVCTIHQPDPSIFASFDNVLIMSTGQIGYFGPPSAAAEHFASLGEVKTTKESIAPWLISRFAFDRESKDEVAKQARIAKIQGMVDQFKKLKLPAIVEEVKHELETVKFDSHEKKPQFRSGWCTQLGTLTSRSITTLYRDRSILYFRFSQQFFLSLILGMLCFRLADAQSSVQSRKGAIFFILRFTMFINVLGQLMLFPLEMPIFGREYKAGLCRSDTFFLAKNIAELPGQIVLPIIFMSIAYWMIGFADDGDRFLAALGIQLIVTSAAASMGYFLSTLSTSVRGVAEAGSNILTTLMLFDGFLINAGSVPTYMRWLGDLSIYKWAYEAFSIVIWQNFPIGCLPGEKCIYQNGNQVLTSLSMKPSRLGLDIGMLFASIFLYRLLSYIFVYVHAKKKPVLID